MEQPYYQRRMEHGGIAQILLIAFLVIVVAAAAVLGTYAWQQHRINDLNNKIAALNTQVANLRKQQQGTSGQAAGTQPPGTASPQSGTSYTSQKGVKVVVETPAKNAKVASPLGVTGEVPGNWSFEAAFPVVLKDSAGNTVASTTATVLGNWQTTELVQFSAKLTWSSSPSGTGTLVLQKDNPSGQAANSDSVSIPVQF